MRPIVAADRVLRTCSRSKRTSGSNRSCTAVLGRFVLASGTDQPACRSPRFRHLLDRMHLTTAHELTHEWNHAPRWTGIERPYTANDVVRLRGTVHIEHTLARIGAERLW